MKKLDLRTMVVMLVVFALGYAVCLAMPIVQAERPDATTVDRLLVTDYIEFENGCQLSCVGGLLTTDGSILTENMTPDTNDLRYCGSPRLKWAHVYSTDVHCTTLHAEAGTGTLIRNLNADLLWGHPANDFILKSEIDNNFCRAFCPIDLEFKSLD